MKLEQQALVLKMHMHLFLKEMKFQKTDRTPTQRMETKMFFERMHRNVEIMRLKTEKNPK